MHEEFHFHFALAIHKAIINDSAEEISLGIRYTKRETALCVSDVTRLQLATGGARGSRARRAGVEFVLLGPVP